GKISETKNFDFQVSKDADLPESPVREPDPTPPPVVHPPVTAPKSDPQDPFPDHVPPITPIQQPTPNQVPAGPVPLTMTVDQDTTRSSSIDFRLPIPFTKQATINKPDPDTIRITLPGVATLALTDTPIVSGVDSVTSQTIGMNTVITVELSRAMGAEVTSSATGVSLRLLKPNVGNGKLAGKVIVVDPGHGGHDRGTHVGLVNEKDLNLSIGTKLAAKLAEAGATVILTRRTDVFIPLMTRSAISNQNHADLFISCHINSTGGEPNQSGTITFHHEGNNVGKLLAECIQDEIAKVNRLPNMGVWSDGRIYETGFSVLRHTHAPAVLIEMGFLNCAKDRARMMTEDFQDAVTTAVVKGLRIYLGDSKPNE
ncbi:MAG TPA: N-acetylmuramoyl-L-alanine amidase, partial [Fimbriimonas sp.]|nr:N-acetylmuramoyl-L-alanine amidase [Fimbriimonas sp.]